MVLNLHLEQRVVLNPCRWETYLELLEQQVDRSAPRFTYSEGVLEIVSPSPQHEELTRVMEAIVQAACERFAIDFQPLGSSTQRRPDLQKGAEPDASYMFGSLERDPSEHPPDLAIEVEVSRSALDKLDIFARLGVPEVWRCSPGGVRIFQLVGLDYQACARSRFLPLDEAGLNLQLVSKSELKWRPWLSSLRSWLGSLPEQVH